MTTIYLLPHVETESLSHRELDAFFGANIVTKYCQPAIQGVLSVKVIKILLKGGITVVFRLKILDHVGMRQ